MSNDYINTKNWLLLHQNKTYSPGNGTSEYDFLYHLIQLHPSYLKWQYKIPVSFKIIKKTYLQLMVAFQPNKYRIVSWVQCTNAPKRKIDPLSSAMRQAVKRQISIYKTKNINRVCTICQSKNIEVDHYPIKFATIKKDFISNIACGVSATAVPTQFKSHPKRGYFMFIKTDLLWKRAWQKYHLKIANYRYLCSACNKKY